MGQDLFMLWIPLTIAAAFLQNARTAIQKRLDAQIGASGATLARFIYAAPLAALYLFGLLTVTGQSMPALHGSFLILAVIGGAGQVLGNALMILVLRRRNFAAGTAYSKTEAAQAAVFSTVLLGEGVSAGGVIGILVSLFGVMLLSLTKADRGLKTLITGLKTPSALMGIGVGAGYAVAAICYRSAALSLDVSSAFTGAAVTLAVVTAIQLVMMLVWSFFRDRPAILATLRAWPLASLVGLFGVTASVGWFTAMALYNVAYVRALGQVELIFTLLTGWIIFREKVTRPEMAGLVLITGGILALLLL